MSQREFAANIGVAPAAVGLWESDKNARLPSIDSCYAIIDLARAHNILNITIEYLRPREGK